MNIPYIVLLNISKHVYVVFKRFFIGIGKLGTLTVPLELT